MRWNLRLIVAVILIACLELDFAAAADLQKLAEANNTFAFKLLKQIAQDQPTANIFISPYSAATALQMVVNGAAGQTKAEMRQVLGITNLTPDKLNGAAMAAAGLLNLNDRNVVLTTANALWYQQGSQIKKSFLDANRNFFSATIKPLDFSNVPAAEKEINQWASDETHGRIADIANGIINPLYTDLILANAIYFKGQWLYPFDKNLTKERTFHPVVGAEKNLPMMAMSKKFVYRKGSDYQAVRLPYLGNNLAMFVFLPDDGSSPEKLLGSMNGDTWQSFTMQGFDYLDGKLILPRFKLEFMVELNRSLAALGMETAFSQGKADFSDMFNDPHFISEVRQKAFVEVGEEGTEAAAVTEVGVSSSIGGIEMNLPKPFEMIVDRPFLFTIVDSRSGMILFIGVVNQL